MEIILLSPSSPSGRIAAHVLLEPDQLKGLASDIEEGAVEVELGDDFDSGSISQPELCSFLLRFLASKGISSLTSRQYNEIFAAATTIVDASRSPFRSAPPECGIMKWLASDEVGLSSLYLAGQLAGRPLRSDQGLSSERVNHPADSGDFGRICTMLDAAPELRAAVPSFRSKADAIWVAILERWDELESLTRKAMGGDKAAGRQASQALDSIRSANSQK